MLTLRAFATVGLLMLSNTFMTFAWYFHVRQHAWSLFVAIGLSWLIALPEYCLQVPANRLGSIGWGGAFTTPQLKVIQEAVTLSVFGVFTVLVLKEKLRTQDLVAFGLILIAVAIAMSGRDVTR